MNFQYNKIDFTERHNVEHKLEKAIHEYIFKHNRYPQLILIDAFSLLSLSDQNTALSIVESKTSFMGVSLQAIETIDEIFILQRLRTCDVAHDAKFHADEIIREQLNKKW